MLRWALNVGACAAGATCRPQAKAKDKAS